MDDTVGAPCPLCKAGYKQPHTKKDWEDYYASQESSTTEGAIRKEG